MYRLFSGRTALHAAVAGVLSLAGTTAFSEQSVDLQAMSWAAACVTCHGAAQPIPGSVIAPLAGMPAADLMSKMEVFIQNDTPGSLMQQIARGYDQDTLLRIAQWYEQLGDEK